MNISGYLLAIDIEKAFDSMNHTFLFSVLKKFGFGASFIDWIKVILNDQESCVMNGGRSTGYFPLQRGARQGDPISSYLFILVLETLFIQIRENQNIKGLQIFDSSYKLTAYADDTSFFVEDKDSCLHIINVFEKFSKFSGLKTNATKCEICGIGGRSGEQVSVCGMKSKNLLQDSIKILGVHYTYNQKVFVEKNYTEIIENILGILKVWKMRNLTTIGKITIFKTLVLSKLVFLSFLTDVPDIIVNKLKELQYDFLWNGKRAKVSHESLIGSYESGGLKSIDIPSKIKALQLSWVKRLYDNHEHPWKIIPKYLFNKYFMSDKIFFPNFQCTIPNKLPNFYKNMIKNWSELSICEPITATSIFKQKIWYNRFLKINNKIIYYKSFANAGISYIEDLYNEKGILRKWEVLNVRYNLNINDSFKWTQLINSIPIHWKRTIHTDLGSSKNNGLTGQHLLQLTRTLDLEKLTSKQLYIMFIKKMLKTPKSEATIQNKLNMTNISWEKVYRLGGEVTIDTYTRMFNFKLNHNILHLNKSLYVMGKHNTCMCSFCNSEEETPIHLFAECRISRRIWSEVQLKYLNNIQLPDLTPQSAYLGFHEIKENKIIINHILLIFKLTLYHSRKKQVCNLHFVTREIEKLKQYEYEITFKSKRKKEFNQNKWKSIN